MWRGNTQNPAPNPIDQKGNVSDVKISENRALNVRRDLDVDRNFTVNLLDIDGAILNYINDYINIHVLDNGDSVKVPVFYASPEKWKSVQKDGGLRDGQGKLQLPVLVFKRNTVAKNQELLTLNRHLSYPIIKKYYEKNKYDNFCVLNKSMAPIHQIYSVTLPDHVTITYQFLAQTEFVEQMNTIIQKINFAAEEYWGDPKRFRFRVYISDYSLTTENQNDKDRLIKSEFSATVQAYLLEDSFEQRQLTTKKSFTPRRIVFNTETVINSQMEAINRSLNNTTYKKAYPYSWDGIATQKDGEKFRLPAFLAVEDFEDLNGARAMNNAIEQIRAAYQKVIIINNNSGTIWHTPPTTTTSPGEEGWMAHDDNYIYIYASGQWYRQSISTGW
jgi:hypothetical protein